MNDEKVTATETAQAALNSIKRACEAYNENVLTALIENPEAIAKLGEIAEQITIDVED